MPTQSNVMRVKHCRPTFLSPNRLWPLIKTIALFLLRQPRELFSVCVVMSYKLLFTVQDRRVLEAAVIANFNAERL